MHDFSRSSWFGFWGRFCGGEPHGITTKKTIIFIVTVKAVFLLNLHGAIGIGTFVKW